MSVILKHAHDNVKPSFETVLDTTCQRLSEKHAQYSIRRIQELDGELRLLENALDELVAAGGFNLHHS